MTIALNELAVGQKQELFLGTRRQRPRRQSDGRVQGGSSASAGSRTAAQPNDPTRVSPIITRIRLLVDMRPRASNPPPGMGMARRSLGKEMRFLVEMVAGR